MQRPTNAVIEFDIQYAITQHKRRQEQRKLAQNPKTRPADQYFPIKQGVLEAARLLRTSSGYREGQKVIRAVLQMLMQLNDIAGDISSDKLLELRTTEKNRYRSST